MLYFQNLKMKIRGVVYYGVVFSKNFHLIDLKLSFKSCATLSGRKCIAFYAKEHSL